MNPKFIFLVFLPLVCSTMVVGQQSLLNDFDKWFLGAGEVLEDEKIAREAKYLRKRRKANLRDPNYAESSQARYQYYNASTPIYDRYISESAISKNRPILKLGNEETGARYDSAHFSFRVDSQFNLFTTEFLVVFEFPMNHEKKQRPSYELRIYDEGGSVIQCATFDELAEIESKNTRITLRFGQITCPILYTDWIPISVDLSNYIGKTLSATIIINDCTLSGHFGYVYIDPYLSKLKMEINNCNGDSMATFSVPEGFEDYVWSTGQKGKSLNKIQIPRTKLDTFITCRFFTRAGAGKKGCELELKERLRPPDSVHFKVQTKDISCAGLMDGKAWVQLDRGLKISWSNNVFDSITHQLSKGVHKIRIEDSTHCQTDTFSIKEPERLSIKQSLKEYNGYNIRCKGLCDGQISLSAEKGTAPYQFRFDGDSIKGKYQAGEQLLFENLWAGAHYIAIVDSNGCTSEIPIILSEPDSFKVNLQAETAWCNPGGGKIASIFLGGVGPQWAEWEYLHQHDKYSNSLSTIDSAKVGWHRVQALDRNGCPASASIEVEGPKPFSFQAVKWSDFLGLSRYSFELQGGSKPYRLNFTSAGGFFLRMGKSVLTARKTKFWVMGQDAHDCICERKVEVQQGNVKRERVPKKKHEKSLKNYCPRF